MLETLHFARVGIYVRDRMQVSQVDLIGKRREGIPARALFVWLARRSAKDEPSFSAIGRWLGGRDHMTTAYLYRTVAPRLRREDRRFRELCEQFQQEELVQ